MLSRTASMKAVRAALEMLEEHAVRKSIVEDGFTRVDPMDLAQRYGITVFARKLEKLLGAFLREDDDQCGIILNTERSTGMIHMTCAHELGHFSLGHLTTADERLDYSDSDSEQEQSADQFAYALVAPAWLTAHLIKTRNWASMLSSPWVVYQLSLRMGLSYEATISTLSRQRKIPPATAISLRRTSPISMKRRLAPPGREVNGKNDVWVLNPADRDCILQPKPTDHFVFALPDHGSAGYLWSVEDAAAEGYAIKPLPMTNITEFPPSDEVWVGGIQEVYFELELQEKKVPVSVSLQESQPWSRTSKPADEVKLHAAYEEIQPGLAPANKKRWLENFHQ